MIDNDKKEYWKSNKAERVLFEIARDGETSSTKWTPTNQARKYFQLKYGSWESFFDRYATPTDKVLTNKVDKNVNSFIPSENFDDFWIYARVGDKDKLANALLNRLKSGKWMLFICNNKIDEVWKIIKKETIKGNLGDSSKVATAGFNCNAISDKEKLICVYTYNYDDLIDVRRVRRRLRELGFLKKLFYKSDEMTVKGVSGSMYSR